MKRLLLCLVLFALASFGGVAQPLALPAAPSAAIVQQPGALLPLALPLLDENGRAVRLGDYFGTGRPVLLVLGYYRCPELCGLLMHGLLEAVHDSGVPRRELRIVRVSIDPEDTPATASARRAVDLASFLEDARAVPGRLDLHLLIGTGRETSQLARAAGFTYQRLNAQDRGADAGALYAHPAAIIVATPRGRISRYLMGIRFEPGELRQALSDASQERVGSLTDRLALLCAHFDPHWGRYSEAVMNGLRALGLLTIAALAAWGWRHRGPPGTTP